MKEHYSTQGFNQPTGPCERCGYRSVLKDQEVVAWEWAFEDASWPQMYDCRLLDVDGSRMVPLYTLAAGTVQRTHFLASPRSPGNEHIAFGLSFRARSARHLVVDSAVHVRYNRGTLDWEE
jgi:hypothetical protein